MNEKLQNAINQAEEREYHDNHLSAEERRALVEWFAAENPGGVNRDAPLDEQYLQIISHSDNS